MTRPASPRPRLLALAAGLALTALVDWRVGATRQAAFIDRLEDTAARLETLPARHQALGASLALAGLAPASRETVTGRLPPDAPEALAALRLAATEVKASAAFLVDQGGTIAAYYLENGRSATGRNLSRRPYVKSALAGRPAMYAAIGSNTVERGIYVAAPVRGETEGGQRVIGAAVIKVGFDQVDPLLAQGSADYALVSPEGVVFASTRPAWRYALTGSAAAQAAAIRHDRAANHFAGHPPRPLADLVPDLATAQAVPVDWADPEGPWRLLGLPRQRFGLTWPEALAVLLAGSGLVAAGLAWREQQRQRERERRQAAGELAGYAQRLEQIAEQKSRLATLTAQLQQADTVEAMATLFLEATAEILGSRQGTVYYLAGDDTLHLAAGYACAADEGARPPARIPLGVGLVGQCARDRQTIQLTGTPEDYWLIRSGLGAAPPANLILIPVLREERLLGVVELATLNPADQEALIRLTDLVPLLALNLELQLSRAQARATTGAAPHPDQG